MFRLLLEKGILAPFHIIFILIFYCYMMMLKYKIIQILFFINIGQHKFNTEWIFLNKTDNNMTPDQKIYDTKSKILPP